MILKLDETAYLNTGLSLFGEGKFFDALKMFNKCSSYEGKLNKVLLTFNLHDFLFGSQSFFEVYLEFRKTHNVFCDVFESLKDLKSAQKFFDCEKADKKRKKSKIDADKSLLLDFSEFECEDFDFDFDLFLSQAKDDAVWFADTKSDEFQDMLLIQADPRRLSDKKQADQAKQKLLLQQTDYVQTNFFRLAEFLNTEQFEKAVETASLILKSNNLEFCHMFCSAETLALYGGEAGLSQAKEALTLVCQNAFEVTSYDVDDAVRLAFNVLNDLDLAEKLAILLKGMPDRKSENLLACFHVFLCAGKINLMRETLLELQSLFPNSLLVEASFTYFDCLENFKFTSFEELQIPETVYRHFNIAKPIVSVALNEVIKKLGNASPLFLSQNDLFRLGLLLFKMPSLVWSDDTKRSYDILFDIVNCMLQLMHVTEKNIEQLKKMAQQYCYQIGFEPYFCALLLWKIACFSKGGKFFLRNNLVCYTLDLAMLKDFFFDQRKFMVFVELACCIELKSSNIKAYSQNFDFLRDNHKELFDKADDMQIACFVYGRFISPKDLLKSGVFTKQNTALLKKLLKKEGAV